MKQRIASHRNEGRRASALVIVLASLAFLAVLALAFLASIGTELKSSKRYADGVSVQLMAQSTFNLAVAQITEATKGVDSANNPLAWASQPGMIRTYTQAGGKGDYFRLYSWDIMTGTGNIDATAEKNALNGWDAKKALFTDLNEPLKTGTETLYPIVDGNNLKTGIKDNSGLITLPGKAYDMDSDGKWDIEGFNVNGLPTVTSNTNPVPMPVKWLYILQDGEIVTATGTSVTKEAQVTGASVTNPIVGRIAFWTDDETCKLNINTASEGTYSDYPRGNQRTSPAAGTNPWDEDILAHNQPINGEFQRYPGHPSMVSLSTVLKAPTGYTAIQWAEELYRILPRVNDGGSKSGSAKTDYGMTITPIYPDADRLYASVDELAFKPLLSGANRGTNNTTVLNKTTLERSKFFLSASSRAPDLNLFNKPRICVWPVSNTNTADYRSAYDNLMVFCSTINNRGYYFQRQNHLSQTVDLPVAPAITGLGRNRMLLEYLRSSTGQNIPGFGGNFSAKYAKDNDQILTQIFDYIRSISLRSTAVVQKYTTGFSTWSSGEGQVVPIYDSVSNTKGFGRFRSIQGATLIFIANADGDIPESQPKTSGTVVPVPAGKLRIQAMFLPQLMDSSYGSTGCKPYFKVVYKNLDNLKWSDGSTTSSMYNSGNVTHTHDHYALDGNYFGDQHGLAQGIEPGAGSLISKSIDMPKSGTFNFLGGKITMEIQTPAGDAVQTVELDFPGHGTLPLPSLAPTNVHNYTWDNKWQSGPFNMRYFGAPPRLVTPNVVTGPDLPGDNEPYTPDDPATTDKNEEKLVASSGGRLTAGGSTYNTTVMFTDYDTVRSVLVAHGDVRLTAAQKTPLASAYAPLGAYNSSTKMRGLHSFWTGNGEAYYGAFAGRMVKGLAYDYLPAANTYYTNGAMGYTTKPPASTIPYLRPGGNGSPVNCTGPDIPFDGVAMGKTTAYATGDLPGDFDNAPGRSRDGAFINKPDEGDLGAYNATSKTYYIPYINWKGRTGMGAISTSMFTPNRIIPSAVNFGSLPTGVYTNRPWQTLLFHPDPSGKHPGGKNVNANGVASSGMPADHLYLDLFNMPVVEPYAISEPLSTAGKINMNYQIMPFTYINRETGIRAILKSERIISIAESQSTTYKQWGTITTPSFRLPIDNEQTLLGFSNRFATNDIFRSATEICELPIVPGGTAATGGATYAQLMDPNINTNYWTKSVSGRRLTGDNSKERPYATIYPRLTTKSNTFTVYARVQSLKKVSGGDPAVWTEGRDVVTGEYRGYQTVERYVDPGNTGIPDYADPLVNTPISTFYKTRVLASKQFAP